MHWRDLIPQGELLLGRSYKEAVNFARTAEWWRDLAVKQAELASEEEREFMDGNPADMG